MIYTHGAFFLSGMGGGLAALWCFRGTILHVIEEELHRRQVEKMPSRIILVRHGESEANANPDVWNSKPDNMIELTDLGCQQARDAGVAIKKIIKDEKAIAVISPFWRTNMTMRNIHKAMPEGQIAETRIEPRVREQEFGNTQTAEKIKEYRRMRDQIGRFWYRFPEGESGADVYSRVASCLQSFRTLNSRRHRTYVDNVIVVTHGLAMRLMLCAEMSWSPDTFHTIITPKNGEFWVLKKTSHGTYCISNEGEEPKSSKGVDVHFHDGRVERHSISQYLDIPEPRTRHPGIALQKLGLNKDEVHKIDYWCGNYSRTD